MSIIFLMTRGFLRNDDKIQDILYEKYEGLNDTQRQTTIETNLMSSIAPVAVFWQRSMMRIADEKTKYRPKDSE